jgi:hypothetical protein
MMQRNSWTDQRGKQMAAHKRRQDRAREIARWMVNAGEMDACPQCGGDGCVECRGLGAVIERKGE